MVEDMSRVPDVKALLLGGMSASAVTRPKVTRDSQEGNTETRCSPDIVDPEVSWGIEV
jgi:hypothetical protein